jgi:hypothetical protein
MQVFLATAVNLSCVLVDWFSRINTVNQISKCCIEDTSVEEVSLVRLLEIKELINNFLIP